MVAHLLRLRLFVLKNSLLRSPWQLIAVIFGGLYGLGMLAAATAGLFALSGAPIELARTIVILGGSAIILGWILLPLLVTGVDQTLDTSRLVTFPIPRGQLLIGLAVCGVLGIPGILTLLAALATAGTWWQHPLIAIVAMVCAVLAALTCVVGSRMLTSLSSSFSSGRRFREIGGLIAFLPLVLMGPIIVSITSGLQSAGDALPGFADALSWTPLGALWAVPSELAVGEYGTAGLKFLIGLATLLVLTLIWKRSLGVALVTPVRAASRQQLQGTLGFFSLLPDTPTGAVAARALTYWLRDPRYARAFLLVPMIPALMFFYSSLNDSPGILNATAPTVALLLGLSIFSDLSYDNTAFSAHVSSGIRGVADRTGRVVAVAIFAVPIVIVFAVASVWISTSWQILPGLLGLSIGVLLTGLGLSSVTSATVVVPVPAPGDSPFKSVPGAGFTSMITTFATWGILTVLILPELLLFIIAAVTGQAMFGWIALVVGAILGPLFLALGIRIGGARLDRRGVYLLEKLVRQH